MEENRTDPVDPSARHYQVLRYAPHPGHGLIVEELGANLTLQEAEALARENAPLVHDEDVVIRDQNITGVEAEVEKESLDGPYFGRK